MANPEKTRLGHLISSEGTSFTPAKRLEVIDFSLPADEKALLQFIGLVNFFRDHVSKMTEMGQAPSCKRTKPLTLSDALCEQRTPTTDVSRAKDSRN